MSSPLGVDCSDVVFGPAIAAGRLRGERTAPYHLVRGGSRATGPRDCLGPGGAGRFIWSQKKRNGKPNRAYRLLPCPSFFSRSGEFAASSPTWKFRIFGFFGSLPGSARAARDFFLKVNRIHNQSDPPGRQQSTQLEIWGNSGNSGLPSRVGGKSPEHPFLHYGPWQILTWEFFTLWTLANFDLLHACSLGGVTFPTSRQWHPIGGSVPWRVSFVTWQS